MGSVAWWILRVAAGMCFVGHGVFGLVTKEEWVPFFGVLGISRDAAYMLMPLIGTIDIALGVAVLLRPRRVFLLYMAAWALGTAALRPLTGQSIFELLERAGNYGVPIALLLFLGPTRSWRDWVSAPLVPALTPQREAHVSHALVWATALLLFGHGALGAVEAKPLLQTHFLTIRLPAAGAIATGWAEMVLAVLVLARPGPRLLLLAALWKIGTELLYPIAGASMWEFIERGGSYGAPLALALLLARTRAPAVASPHVSAVSRVAAVLLMAVVGVAAPARAQEAISDEALVAALRAGGHALACRHAQTDSAMDRGPDRASQRNLNAQGVRHAQTIGAAIRALDIPIGEVRANPMYRNRETAEYAFGQPTVDSTLVAGEALRAMLGTPVPPGTNRAIVVRIGTLNGALDGHGVGLIEMGDCIVVQPLDGGGFRVVRHLKVGDWARLTP